MNYISYVEKETICINGVSTPIVMSEDAIEQINKAIQQRKRIVTFYETLEEYRFDLTGYKYVTIEMQTVAGTVERYDFETSEIELLLDDDFFTKKLIGINNHNATRLMWTEGFLDQFKVVIRGLCHVEKGADTEGQIAILDKFVCFDLIPKKEE